MVSIGEAIKAVRKQCDLRQIDIANAMTVTQSYISQIENGREIPTAMFIKLFCLLYSVDERKLLN